MSYHQPTDAEVRARIKAIKDEKYRHAFMYQLLICGRISEVCGKYAPRGTDFIEAEFDVEIQVPQVLDGKEVIIIERRKIPAVIFVVKTAKRKGRLRPCALPLNPEYEPWVKPVFDYYRKADDDYPFMFHENFAHSVRYAQWEAEKAFDGLMWPLIGYTKSIEIPYKLETVLTTRHGDTGYEEYLVELENGSRYWTYDKEFVKESEKVPERWTPFRSHSLRRRREITLTLDYEFDGIDSAYFGGWTESGKDKSIPVSLKHYLHMDLKSAEECTVLLKKMANRYFHKLCIPYSS